MTKKRAHKETKKLMDSTQGTNIDPTMLTTGWQGRITILDATKSFIAKKLGIEEKGEYAIKVR